ncbi:LysR family transcriptional regulator [Clostridium sp.]|uniref:LysR family transcriptional regulator n=1 Tax=Clostridium sp. TaxID=1506 RepID=UPI003216AE9B
MDIRHFVTFKNIVDTGSFINAANKLGYTQSTITSHVQQLEDSLNVKLFEKIGRKMALTNFGKDLLPLTTELLNVLDKIEQIGKDSDNITGELKIAAPETLTIYKLEPILKEFREKAPNVNLSIINSSCNDIKNRTIKGEVDIALLFEPCNENDNLYAKPLVEIPLVFVCSPNEDVSNIDLNIQNQTLQTSIIVNESECIYRNLFEEYLKNKNIIIDNIIELWSVESIKKCVQSGIGIALLPDIVVAQEIKLHQLQLLSANSTNLIITASIAYHKNKCINPSIKLFMKIVEKHFNL